MRKIGCRILNLGERLLFPEARSAAEQWQRVAMNEAVSGYLSSLDLPTCRAAEISGDAHAARRWKEYASLMYPSFDLCAPLQEARRFDVVICEQVLEHVLNPWTAAANLRDLCVAGGHVIVTTPFLIKVHELPMYDLRDYWRFTPRGLRTLLEQVGLEVQSIGAWGNRACSATSAAGRSIDLSPQREDVPVQVWAFARRPW
jgi:SAM-dependent methyltransferase